MPKLLLEALASCLLIRTGLAVENSNGDALTPSQSPTPGLGNYILHGLGRAFSGSPTPAASMSTSTVATTSDPGPPPWTVSVPKSNIAWSGDFNPDYVTHAQSCWDVYTSWYASWYASSISGKTTIINSTSLATFTTSSTIYPAGNISTYKLCDGTPRAHYSPSTTVFVTTLTEVFSNIVKTTSPVIPEPQCRPNQDDCAVLYYGTNLTDYSDRDFARVRLYGACGDPLDSTFPCLIQGGPVQLLYFPVTTTGGGLCGPDGTIVTPTSAPKPITTLGTTLFPDSVYISFETLYAAYRPFTGPGGAAAQIGPTFSNTIMAFKSQEISTNCYATWWNQTQTSIPGYGPGTQLNFADLNSPVSASAYECQNQCLDYSVPYTGGEYVTQYLQPNWCETILDNFNPLIAVPTRLRDMVPEWKKCKFWSPRQANVIFDPPQALTEASLEAKPTAPPGYSNPSPSPTPTPPVALPTGTAEQENVPSSPESANQPPASTGLQSQEGVTLPNQSPASSPSDPPTDPSPSQQHDSPAGTTIIAGSRTITASFPSDATNVALVEGTTLSPGGSAISIDGQMVSMGSQGLVAVDAVSSKADSTTSSLSSSSSRDITSAPAQISTTPSSSPATTSSGAAHKILHSSDLIVNNQPQRISWRLPIAKIIRDTELPMPSTLSTAARFEFRHVSHGGHDKVCVLVDLIPILCLQDSNRAFHTKHRTKIPQTRLRDPLSLMINMRTHILTQEIQRSGLAVGGFPSLAEGLPVFSPVRAETDGGGGSETFACVDGLRSLGGGEVSSRVRFDARAAGQPGCVVAALSQPQGRNLLRKTHLRQRKIQPMLAQHRPQVLRERKIPQIDHLVIDSLEERSTRPSETDEIARVQVAFDHAQDLCGEFLESALEAAGHPGCEDGVQTC
ncbi:hypothetical protein M409DRAFT_54362 [Zasmidium cellare ATCC 36951]|uniref:Uncharacterized protein n=1 Tax=Zasmidium cellare ATCC 36951 TaxID=1080233 RepID=A0A6A6CJF3_ZASCE|nr:uncharacterized protein M409DRAFT_54362 [Zasmidium cellare ATCC 36951]KAF2167171.1 hypothetical protein M409DRAFT_54362 [Zasmidium cellare ATCC 36951]